MKHNYKIKAMSLIMGTTLATASITVSASDALTINVSNQTNKGAPTFVTGNLGSISSSKSAETLKNILAAQSSYGFTGNEDFQIRRQWTDSLGKSHVHFDQTINGLKVYGTSLIMHANNLASGLTSAGTSGQVYAVSGRLAVDSTPAVSAMMRANHDRGDLAMSAARSIGKVIGKPELAYVYIPETEDTKLAWKIDVTYTASQGFEHDIIFFDANSVEELTRHPQVHRAKVYNTHTYNNRPYTDSSQKQLLCSTGQTCSDAAAQRAHSGAAAVYDYYQQVHGRDGINGSGMTMNSNVHVGTNWNNASWYQNQMFYGEGDGQTFTDLTNDYDIIGHELTHGVTQFSGNMIYQNESGAINEAWSDIMGISAEAYRNGTTSPNWTLGGDAYTPNTPGDGLRYMNNPTQDGRSYDYYPERYTGTQDRGGVHLNSGIANLAYVLLVQGGTHPRSKTTANVPAIGLSKAEKIFYRALTTYFNQSTNFSGARTGTVQAAADLYGQTEKTAVETAWCAVGVGDCPGSTNPPGDNVLENGVAVSNLTATSGNDVVYTMEVPTGATDISFAISGGTGDADLYVKFGSTPTDSSYDCRPYKSGNSETCSGSSSGGTYYVRVKAYSTFSGLNLTGSYTADGGGGGLEPINDTIPNISVSQGQWQRYTQELPAGYASMTISISGGSGDTDLYVRRGAQSTSTQYDCRPYRNGNNETCSFTNPAAGTWYIDLYGYSTSSGVTLTLEANP